MLIHEALSAYIEGQTTVTDLLWSTKAIYTDKAPAGVTYNFIKLELQSDRTEYSTERMLDLAEARVLAHCRGKTITVASDIAEELRKVFVNGYQGTMGSLIVRNCRVVDFYEEPSGIFAAKAEGLPSYVVEFEIHYIVKGTAADP